MIDLFKDRYKLSMAMTALFFIGIIASLYQIYRLPSNLMLANETHPAFTNVYLILGATFLIGGIALWWTLSNRNEVIIFKEKQAENTNVAKEQSDAGKTTISLDSVKQQLKSQDVLKSGLQAICKQLDAGQGAIYMITEKDGHREVELKSGYALTIGENTVVTYDMGEGLIGQTAVSGKSVYLDDVPEGYVKIVSGLGNASPKFILISPMKKGDAVLGVVEIASFTPLTEDQRKFVEEASQLITEKIGR